MTFSSEWGTMLTALHAKCYARKNTKNLKAENRSFPIVISDFVLLFEDAAACLELSGLENHAHLFPGCALDLQCKEYMKFHLSQESSSIGGTFSAKNYQTLCKTC